eukprot:TRINITY_DN638_c0_g1_i1.p1 TRINITY_DN638_c0_g1~~TRINITY_DN638_c0_g1_i1.p1  ORF type:complete len:1300 (+),score=329.16 TRINITY_DN638_c0_g1_i1:544-4443(+)
MSSYFSWGSSSFRSAPPSSTPSASPPPPRSLSEGSDSTKRSRWWSFGAQQKEEKEDGDIAEEEEEEEEEVDEEDEEEEEEEREGDEATGTDTAKEQSGAHLAATGGAASILATRTVGDDGEGDFLDSHQGTSPPESLSISMLPNGTSGYAIESHKDDEDSEEYDDAVNEDDGAAKEEAIAGNELHLASLIEGTGNVPTESSPVGLSSTAAATIAKLNKLAGIENSDDLQLLSGVDEEGFKARIAGMKLDDPTTGSLLKEILPLVRKLNQGSLSKASVPESKLGLSWGSSSGRPAEPVMNGVGGAHEVLSKGTEGAGVGLAAVPGLAASVAPVTMNGHQESATPGASTGEAPPKQQPAQDGAPTAATLGVSAPPPNTLTAPSSALSGTGASTLFSSLFSSAPPPSAKDANAAAAPSPVPPSLSASTPPPQASSPLPGVVSGLPPMASPSVPAASAGVVQATASTPPLAAPSVPQGLGGGMGSAGPTLSAVRSDAPQPVLFPNATAAARPAAAVTTQRPAAAAPGVVASTANAAAPAANGLPPAEPAEGDVMRQKLMDLRTSIVRACFRAAVKPQNSMMVQRALQRVHFAEQMARQERIQAVQLSAIERLAKQREEAEGATSDLGIEINFLFVGKSGVGKTATINSLLEREGALATAVAPTSASAPCTKRITEFVGSLHGVKIRCVDTPGLHSAMADSPKNEKILQDIKRYAKKRPFDMVLYVDRVDVDSDLLTDATLFAQMTAIFGQEIWGNMLVVLTHSMNAPGENTGGTQLQYEVVMQRRIMAIRRHIQTALREPRVQTDAVFAENSAICRRNQNHEKVLPNGSVWRPEIFLVAVVSKTLASLNSIFVEENARRQKLIEEPRRFNPFRPIGSLVKKVLSIGQGPPGAALARRGQKYQPLATMFNQLISPREPVREADDQGANEEDMAALERQLEADGDIPESDFRRLSKEEEEKLKPEILKQYHEELKKEEEAHKRREFLASRREKRAQDERKQQDEASGAQPPAGEEPVPENQVPVQAPDVFLPPSFDGDNPAHRYRALDNREATWLVRPMLEQQTWDHDVGYDTLQVEKVHTLPGGLPAVLQAQVHKDKKEQHISLEMGCSKWHGDSSTAGLTPVTSGGFEMIPFGREDKLYMAHVDHRLRNFGPFRAGGGLSCAWLMGVLSKGLKLEGRFFDGNRAVLSSGLGLFTGNGDQIKGGNVDLTWRHSKYYPLAKDITQLSGTLLEWKGDVILQGNVNSTHSIGPLATTLRGMLNNRGTGQLSVRFATHEDQAVFMAAASAIPLFMSFLHSIGIMGGEQ